MSNNVPESFTVKCAVCGRADIDNSVHRQGYCKSITLEELGNELGFFVRDGAVYRDFKKGIHQEFTNIRKVKNLSNSFMKIWNFEIGIDRTPVEPEDTDDPENYVPEYAYLKIRGYRGYKARTTYDERLSDLTFDLYGKGKDQRTGEMIDIDCQFDYPFEVIDEVVKQKVVKLVSQFVFSKFTHEKTKVTFEFESYRIFKKES